MNAANATQRAAKQQRTAAKTVDQIGAREATKSAHRAKPMRVAKGCEEQFEVIAKEAERTARAEDRLRKVLREGGVREATKLAQRGKPMRDRAAIM